MAPISKMAIVFFNSSPEIPKLSIFGRKFNDFYFCTKLWNKANSRITNMTTVFSNYSPKIYKLRIFVPKLKDFYFSPNFVLMQIRGH